jgi:hypothetical protein
MSLCFVALSSFEEHEAKLAVLCRGKATKGRAPLMVRTAIRNQVFNLSNLIIVSVLYLKSATKLLNFYLKIAEITYIHLQNGRFKPIFSNYVPN